MIKNERLRGRERGAVLVVSLILLLVLTLFGLNSMRETTMEERMAGNWRDQNYALQSAEAALRAGENFLRPRTLLPATGVYPGGCSPTACEVFKHRRLAGDATVPDATADLLANSATSRNRWRDASTVYAGTLPGVATPPRYLIEHRDYVRDHLVTGFGTSHETGRDQYQVTARGTGQTDESEVILQSAYSKRFN